VKRPESDPELLESKESMLKSRWVKILTEEQGQDGGWARFHSMDHSVKRKGPTTEAAVGRIVQLGVDAENEIVQRTISYLEGLLSGRFPWPEHKERNDRWPTGQEMFVAAMLAELQPDHELLAGICHKWCKIAEATFASGMYDPEAECRAHCRLTGATSMRGSYLVVRNWYALILLSCRHARLAERTEKALLDWLWAHPKGIGYADVPLTASLGDLKRTSGQRWLSSQMLLSRFPSWPSKVSETIQELWALRNEDGLWDFGKTMDLAKLSEGHRKKVNRTIDHSIHVLLLLDAYHSRDVMWRRVKFANRERAGRSLLWDPPPSRPSTYGLGKFHIH
jgi:hypothetical protein